MKNKDLKRRIIEISYKQNLSHLGSCLTAVDIIDEIFQVKKPDEKFVLSSGHAGLALYVVLEKYDKPKYLGDGVYDYVGLLDAEKIFAHHGVHPDYCKECHLDCSSGSLGNGLPIALGMALANRLKNVYCLISDGECAEGSIWEAMRIKDEQKLDNLIVYLNWNGFGAYGSKPFPTMLIGDSCSMDQCEHRAKGNLYYPPNINKIIINHFTEFPFLKGQDAHYYIMKEEDYKQGMEVLK